MTNNPKNGTMLLGGNMKQRKNKGNLANYKAIQTNIAKQKGVYEQLMEAKTITEAKKIVYGKRIKKNVKYRGHSGW